MSGEFKLSSIGFPAFNNALFMQQQLQSPSNRRVADPQDAALQADAALINQNQLNQGQQTQNQSQEADALSGVQPANGVEPDASQGENQEQGMSAEELQGRLLVSQGQGLGPQGLSQGMSQGSDLEQRYSALEMEISQRLQSAKQSTSVGHFDLSSNTLQRANQSMLKFREDAMELAQLTGEMPPEAEEIFQKMEILQSRIERATENNDREMEKKEQEKEKYKIDNGNNGQSEAVVYPPGMDNQLSNLKNVMFNVGPGSNML